MRLSDFLCGAGMSLPEGMKALPDAGEGACCIGAAMGGPNHCTCWEPVFAVPQQPLQPGPAPVAAQQCEDCAYRPGSPERSNTDSYSGDQDLLRDIVCRGEPFYCHQGIRRPIALRHGPSGMEIPAHPANYQPPILDAQPYRADGTPAAVCAGWTARRLAFMQGSEEALDV